MQIKNKKNRLGRGLDVLLSNSNQEDRVLFLGIEKIQVNPKQPRKFFDEEALSELSASIKEHGILQPILVQELNNEYQIISGERRWRAACKAGMHTVPTIVKSPNASQVALWALIENLQREELNPIEEARAFKQILEEQNLSQQELAQNLGRSRSSVTNTLRLLQLDKQVQQLLETKKLAFAQARELLRFKSPEEQKRQAQACLKKNLTVKKLSSRASKKQKTPLSFYEKQALIHLQQNFAQKVQLKLLNKSGQLIFSFKNEEDMKQLFNKLWDK